MKILRSKLYEAQQEKQNAAIAAQRKSQVGTGDRSGKIRTYNFPRTGSPTIGSPGKVRISTLPPLSTATWTPLWMR